MNVFEIVEHIPKGTILISCKWVFKYKHDENGNITKRKVRLVFRIDYLYTFSSTLKLDSLRIIVAITVQRKFKIMQIDINAT